MTISDVINRYHITLPSHKYILEYFMETSDFKTYNMDFLPQAFPKKNIYKFEQIEVFFQEVLEKKIDKKYFLKYEEKFINILLKLWLFSDTFIQVDSIYVKHNHIYKHLDPVCRKLFSKRKNNIEMSSFQEITQKNELILYTNLGTRNIGNVIYYLSDLDILIFSNWFCFSVVFLDEKNYSFVKKIVESEGLFLNDVNNTY